MKKETDTENQFKAKTSPKAEPALRELFLDGVMDIFWAENHLLKVLPKMIDAATSKKLKKTITDHLTQTQTHISRLEQVFELLGEKKLAKKCDAMEGISKEGEGIVESTEAGTITRDVGIILASQKVEHYEIATYGGLAQLAKTLGHADVAGLLEQTLGEEKEADRLLTDVAKDDINDKASEEA